MSNFDRKTVTIKLLKNDPGKEYTSYQIATYIFKNYPAEMERKIQTSNDKRLFRVRSKAQEKEIITKIYAHEFDKEFRADIQRIEPKIRITKKGFRVIYCYINNANKIVNYEFTMHKEFELKSIVVNFLRNSLGKEYTSSQIATWIFDNYPAEMERKIQESNDKRLLKARSNTLKRKIAIMIYRNEFNKEFRAAIQKMDSKIKIIKKGTLFKYCYINNADRIIDCDNILYNEFDSIDAAIKFLKTNAGREFTNSQIATWLVNTYPDEAERKAQASNDKRLLNTTNKLERKKIVIKIYIHELNRKLRSSLQKREPKIKITKRGRRARYCYVDSTDKIFDKFKVIKTLQNHKQQEFTAHEMAQLLLGTNR